MRGQTRIGDEEGRAGNSVESAAPTAGLASREGVWQLGR
jgi:hypothetical protein